MINIIKYKIKEQFKSILYYLVGLLLYSFMIVGLFPSIGGVKSAALQSIPEPFMKFFGGDITSLTSFNGFISIEFLSLFFVLIVAFYIGASAGSTIAGSIEKKTMDFQLSQPISRTKIVIAEAIVSLIYTFILVFATSLSIYIFGQIFNIDVSNQGLVAFTVVATTFLWAIYGIAILFSAVLKNKITVASATVSLVMAFYVLTAMTSIVEKLKNYNKFSIFYAYNPQKLLENGQINLHHIEALLLILIVGLVTSIFIFNKKDI